MKKKREGREQKEGETVSEKQGRYAERESLIEEAKPREEEPELGRPTWSARETLCYRVRKGERESQTETESSGVR